MSTFLSIKNLTAGVLGRTDGSTANTIRDNIINTVIQNEIANHYKWSWLLSFTTITTDGSGQVDLPSDFNPNHDLKFVHDTSENSYVKVPVELYQKYASGDYVYYIDYNNSTKRWRFNTPNLSTALSIAYYFIPTTLTQDTDNCIVPDIDAIAYLSASRFWLSSERDETNHDRFKQLGLARLQQMVLTDKKANPQRTTRSSVYSHNLGWN